MVLHGKVVRMSHPQILVPVGNGCKRCKTYYNIRIYEGDNPLGVRVRRYEVREGSVRSTQNSLYSVRKHNFLLKGPIFIRKHNKRDILV